MMTGFRVIAILATLVAPSPIFAQQPEPADRILAQFANPDRPGCSVAVGRDGHTLMSQSFGLANLEHRVEVTSSTRFDSASVAKQFTAAAILLLAQDGKLTLDDDVRAHLPEFPDFGQRVTIDHLLTHMSGLRETQFLTELQGWWPMDRRQISQEELVALLFRQRELNFTPGSRWSYSNSNYVLAAEIVRRVSGKPLREFLQERVFGPLRMTSTIVRDDYAMVIPHEATGYAGRSDDLKRTMPNSLHGSGNVLTTPTDLLLWNHALDSEGLGPYVSRELQRVATTPNGRPVQYARGLFVGEYRGVLEVSHSGGRPGATAYAARYPDQKLAVAVTCNSAFDVERMAHLLIDQYLTPGPGRTATPTLATAATVPSADLNRYVGLFFDASRGMHIRAGLRDGKLLWGSEVAEPISSTRFRLPQSREIVFVSPDQVDTANLLSGARTTFRRIDDRKPSQAELQALAGEYRSAELDAVYRVTPTATGISLSIVGEPSLEFSVEAVSRDIFDGGRDTIRFVRSAGGRGETLLFSNARNREIRFERIRVR